MTSHRPADVENIEVVDTLSEEEMAVLAVCELQGQVRNGIDSRNVCKIVKEWEIVMAVEGL
ncbi:MAG: hypothetical protein FIB08_09350 [Candidatus Methanoperedens sp.]|nr:hypothetical protein [Candidatus Methanoperedens sp.]